VSSTPPHSDHSAQAALNAALLSVAGGDRKALAQVFDRTSAKLMGICLRVLKDREEAEDVLQDVFVSIWSRAGSFDPAKASPITWLATIARNRAIDRLRSRRARGTTAPVTEILHLADDRPDGFAVAAAKDEGGRVHHCLSTLEDKAQEVIRTAFFDGLSYSDLAVRSGVPLGTVKSWIRRGLQRLRDCLEA
jgi:RNA polymerase sigma-70 factor (ECF subfamily)